MWKVLLLAFVGSIAGAALHALAGYLVFARDRDFTQAANDTVWYAVKAFVILAGLLCWAILREKREPG